MDNNHKWKYNYILYNMENGYKWDMYRELKELPNVRMCRGALPMNEPLLHKLHKIHKIMVKSPLKLSRISLIIHGVVVAELSMKYL